MPNGPLQEIKEGEDQHVWAGEEAQFKWLDIQLSMDKKAIKFSRKPNEEVNLSGYKDEDGKAYYKCDHCDAIWDQYAYPKVNLFPFEHIRCPVCGKVVAQKYPTKEEML